MAYKATSADLRRGAETQPICECASISRVTTAMTTASGVTTVEHEKGLHARPASVFVQTASEFEADVQVANPEGETADATSSIGVISLGVESGDRIEITADGTDADRAVDRLVTLVESDFETDGE